MTQLQEIMVTSGKQFPGRPRVSVKSGDKETRKIDGQKMTLWVWKDQKGCFNRNPIPVPTCWIEENDIFESVSGGPLDHSLKNGAMDASGFLALPREKLQNSKRFFSCGLAEPLWAPQGSQAVWTPVPCSSSNHTGFRELDGLAASAPHSEI